LVSRRRTTRARRNHVQRASVTGPRETACSTHAAWSSRLAGTRHRAPGRPSLPWLQEKHDPRVGGGSVSELQTATRLLRAAAPRGRTATRTSTRVTGVTRVMTFPLIHIAYASSAEGEGKCV